jgi:hypothetical protein
VLDEQLESDFRWHSKLGFGSGYDFAHDLGPIGAGFGVGSRAMLDAEADADSKKLFPENKFCRHCGEQRTRVHVVMFAPKTHKRPRRGCCSVTVDVIWSPWDQVPNQGFPDDDGPYFWRPFAIGGGEFSAVDNRQASWDLGYRGPFREHQFESFLVPLPEVTRSDAGWWLPTGRTVVGLLMITNIMNQGGTDELWVCHSQGCNMAMYSLNRSCGNGYDWTFGNPLHP